MLKLLYEYSGEMLTSFKRAHYILYYFVKPVCWQFSKSNYIDSCMHVIFDISRIGWIIVCEFIGYALSI